MELRWKSSLSATGMHAVLCRRLGVPPADARFETFLQGPAEELEQSIRAAGWGLDAALLELAGLSADIANDRELAVRVATRLYGGPAAQSSGVAGVASAIAAVESALHAALPQLTEELRVRQRPLREQWEARGPGVLHAATRLTEPESVPSAAEVVLVGPYAGGHGLAHLHSNRVLFEAVLANPVPELPETLRLAWLLLQLNGDLPRYADLLPAGRMQSTIQLAMIPVVLASAEVVELASCSESNMALAIDVWLAGHSVPNAAASNLAQWWAAHLDAPARWPVALAALAAMLGS